MLLAKSFYKSFNTFMDVKITPEHYQIVKNVAFYFARNNDSVIYELYLNIGLDGLCAAYITYKNDMGTKFTTYAHTCVIRAINNLKKKYFHNLPTNVDGYDMEAYTQSMEPEPSIDTLETELTNMIKCVNKGRTRDVDIVLRNLGYSGYDPMPTKDIAVVYDLGVERVRQVIKNTKKSIRENKEFVNTLKEYI